MVITDYIKFCISTTIPVKHIKKYPNSKPWITPHIIHSLRGKQKAFQQKDWVSLKIKTREIKTEIFKAKLRYKEKLEQQFSTMNTKQAFQKVSALTNLDSKPSILEITNPISFAENLNTFYTRFDTKDYSEDCKVLLDAIPLPDPTYPAPSLWRTHTSR